MYSSKLLKLSSYLYKQNLKKEAQQIISIAANSSLELEAPPEESTEEIMPDAFKTMWRSLKERIDQIGGSISESQAKHIFKLILDANARCAYCNDVIQPTKRKYNLDRLDNDNEYELGNLVFACYRCNAVKSNSDIKDLLSFSADVVKNLNYRNSTEGKKKLEEKAQQLKQEIETKIQQASTQTSIQTSTRMSVNEKINLIKEDILNVLTDLFLKEKLGKINEDLFLEIDDDTMKDFLEKFRGNLFKTLKTKYPGEEYGDFSFTYGYLKDNILIPALKSEINPNTRDAINYITQLTEYEKNKETWAAWRQSKQTEINSLLKESNTFEEFNKKIQNLAKQDGLFLAWPYIQKVYNKTFKKLKEKK